jgi:hypothetical protein
LLQVARTGLCFFCCFQFFLQCLSAVFPEGQRLAHGGGVLLEPEHILLKQQQALICRQVGPDGGAEQDEDRCGHRQRHGQDEVPASQDRERQRKIDGNGQCRHDDTERAAEAQEPPSDECGECQRDERPAEGSRLDHVLSGQQTVEKLQMCNDGGDWLPSRQ